MSNVVEMQSFPAVDLIPPHHSLKLLSRSLAILFTLFAALQILWVVAALIATVFYSDHLLVGSAGFDIFSGKPPVIPGKVLYSSQTAFTRGFGLVDAAIASTPFLLVFWELRGLFLLYARGIVFARENAVRLKRIGLWLIAYPFAKFVANMIFQFAGGLDKTWFHMELVYALVAGFTVLAIAQVMEFGREIEQEKNSFI